MHFQHFPYFCSFFTEHNSMAVSFVVSSHSHLLLTQHCMSMEFCLFSPEAFQLDTKFATDSELGMKVALLLRQPPLMTFVLADLVTVYLYFCNWYHFFALEVKGHSSCLKENGRSDLLILATQKFSFLYKFVLKNRDILQLIRLV